MNSVLEYIRQLNQQSVTLPNVWLDRLRHVECDSAERALTPEIVLTRESDIRRGGAVESGPPVTLVGPSADLGTDHIRKHGSATTPSTPHGNAGLAPDASTGFLEPVDTWQDLNGILREVIDESHDLKISSHDPVASSGSDLLPPDPAFDDMHTATPEGARAPLSDPEPLDPFAQMASSHAIIDSLRQTDPGDGHDLANRANSLDRLERETGIRIAGDAADAARSPDSGKRKYIVDDKLAQRFDYRKCSRPKSIDRVADRLLERFPPVSSTTLMLIAAHAGIDVDGIAGQVATCLATRDLGGILLIDGNTGSRQLSSLMGTGRSDGLAEVIHRAASLSGAVCPTDNPRLEFLPCGTGDITHRKLDTARCSQLTRELNQSFQFSVISGGMADDTLAQSWSPFIDGVCLLLDPDIADRERIRGIVNELHSRSVRIAGCIAVQT